MQIYLDTEYNGFGGELISMALVAECGDEWYRVLPCQAPTPWVRQHGMPVMNKRVCSRDPRLAAYRLTTSLGRWLRQFDRVNITADYPTDFELFCKALVLGRGCHVVVPPMTLQLRFDLPSVSQVSATPHNALEDARALRKLATGGRRRGSAGPRR